MEEQGFAADARVRRRDQIASAAIEVLATQGLRGLTHRAVDSAAGLGSGAVNYHAPTRAKLIGLALEELFDRDLAVAAKNFEPLLAGDITLDLVVERFLAFIDEMTAARERVVARHLLLGEAQTDPEIRAVFDSQRQGFVDFTTRVVEALELPDPEMTAETTVIFIDGIISRQVIFGSTPLTELRPMIERLLMSWASP
ncbi:TetR/AcrR family transcriptional regulator [Actinomycetes bacterium M1A6_2h]